MRLGEQILDVPTALRPERVSGRSGARPRRRDPPRGSRRRRAGGGRRRAPRLEGTVDLVEELGSETLVHFHIDAPRLSATDALLAEADDEPETLGVGEIGAATATAGVARVAPGSRVAADQPIVFAVETEKIHLFDPETGESLRTAA